MDFSKTDRFADMHDSSASSPDRASAANAASDGEPGGPAALRQLQEQLEKLGALIRFYCTAKVDAAGASVRRAILMAIAGVFGLCIAATLLVTSTVVAVLGLANLVARELDDQLWAGYLITGVGFLLLFGLIFMVAMSRLSRSSRERTVRKYAQRHQQQRAQFGHDLVESSRKDFRPRS